MDPLIAYMTAADEPTATEQGAALAAALRRKADLGLLGTLSGGRLAKPGAALLDSAGGDQNSFMHATVARTAAADRKHQQALAALQHMVDAKAKAEENAIDNARAERSIDAQIANAEATRALAGAQFGLAQKNAESADAARNRLSEPTVKGLTALPVAENEVDRVFNDFKRLNMGGFAGKAGAAATNLLGLQNTDAAEFDASALQAMQAAGKILEEGKLQGADEVKYKKMLPRPGDSDEVLNAKTKNLKAYLRELAGRQAQGLKAAGYNVPANIDPTQAAPQKQKYRFDGKQMVPVK